MVIDYLSHPTFENHDLPIRDFVPDKQLFSTQNTPWFADIVNFLVACEMP